MSVGIDIIEISRIQKAVQNPRFLKKLFSEVEIEFFKSRGMNVSTIAGSFAAKEAFIKALGFSGVSPRSIEILRDSDGKPYIVTQITDKAMHLSISHCRSYAIAVVYMEGETDENSKCRADEMR